MIYLLEGNIGAGKSTLLNRIAEHYGNRFVLIQEPVDEWSTFKDKNGKSIFEHFYEDKARYSFMFQVFVMQSRLHRLLEAIRNHPNAIVFMERSLYSDYYIFADLLHTQNLISDMEYSVYKSIWNNFVRNFMEEHIKGVIYLHVEPEVALERIKVRNRNGESAISLDYLKALHEQHQKWLIGKEHADCNVDNILVLDAAKHVELTDVIGFLEQTGVNESANCVQSA